MMNRDLFKQALSKIVVKTARSTAVYSVKEALRAAKDIRYPVMMRSGFSRCLMLLGIELQGIGVKRRFPPAGCDLTSTSSRASVTVTRVARLRRRALVRLSRSCGSLRS